MRPSDTVARFGGDEFVVLCDDVEDVSDAIVVAERIGVALAAPFHIARRELHIGASIGIAMASDRSRPAEALVRDADQTMYRGQAPRHPLRALRPREPRARDRFARPRG